MRYDYGDDKGDVPVAWRCLGQGLTVGCLVTERVSVQCCGGAMML
jgi:hypothetical protein